MPKYYDVLTGGSTDFRSPYATTSALAFRGQNYGQRPPATPWMGEPQSRFGYMDSGFQKAAQRDPPVGKLDINTAAREQFSKPKYTSLEETRPYPGPKDQVPLKSCLQRGEVKEPRFYPNEIGAKLGAHALLRPAGPYSTSMRFEKPPPPEVAETDLYAPTFMCKDGTKPASGFSTGNGLDGVEELITCPQSDGIQRTMPLTMRGAEKVAALSSIRYFHARDYYDNRWMTSNSYFQNDAVDQFAQYKARKEALTAVPATSPLTQFALYHNDAPYAPDVGEGVGAPIPSIGDGVTESWGQVPYGFEPSVGLLPSGYSRCYKGKTDVIGSTGEEPPPAPPLPERFRRIRARHDYLRWGAEQGQDHYLSTSRQELPHPRKMAPLGGPTKLPPGGARVEMTDHSGYHMQVSVNPIPKDPGCE